MRESRFSSRFEISQEFPIVEICFPNEAPTSELKHRAEHELKSSTGIITGDLCCQHWWGRGLYWKGQGQLS